MYYLSNFQFIIITLVVILSLVDGFIVVPASASWSSRSLTSKLAMVLPIPNSDLTIVDSVLLPNSQALFKSSYDQAYGPRSPLMDGVQAYPGNAETSTTLLSLQEIKKVTKEEIEQKKTTFNLIFWGGGFVAPFIATVFYFGFKFWEK